MVLKGVKFCTNFQFPSEWSWKKSTFAVWAMVLKWVNLHQFPKFFQMVLKGVSLCCYTTCCLDFGCHIHVVWWCSTAVLVAFLPLLWLHGGHSPGLHGELSSFALHGNLSSVHGGLPGLLGSHGLHGGLSSSALHGDLSSVHGGLPGLLGITGAVCSPAAWLCIAGVESLQLCRSCLWWVLLPVYGWFLFWNET